jgi:flagellar biosynthetic protein FliQ
VDGFDAILRETLLVTALLTLPVLILATLVGAAVAIVQAATQIQEQTLTLLPKLLCVGLMIALFGRFGFTLLSALFVEIVHRVPELVRG